MGFRESELAYRQPPLTATTWFTGALLPIFVESIALSVAFTNCCICSERWSFAKAMPFNSFLFFIVIYCFFLTPSLLMCVLCFCSSAFQPKSTHTSSIWYYNLQSKWYCILKPWALSVLATLGGLNCLLSVQNTFPVCIGTGEIFFFQLLALFQGTWHTCNFRCDETSLMPDTIFIYRSNVSNGKEDKTEKCIVKAVLNVDHWKVAFAQNGFGGLNLSHASYELTVSFRQASC